MNAGIDKISFYVPDQFLDLKTLAAARGVDPNKFYTGIGQERMAVPSPDEDVVTMGANAAFHALQGVDSSSLDMLIFATESGIDQSKAAGVYVHQLLGLPSSCKAFEVKQACSGGTAGLLMALALVNQRPDKKVLLVCADVARYGLGTPGEPTQGAGACAMVISANPRILAIDPRNGSYTEDVMDFWRPNYMDEALVDGKASIRIYIKALLASWEIYAKETGLGYGDHSRFCYHLPFTRMAEKAHGSLVKQAAPDYPETKAAAQIEAALCYNRIIGNTYTASLYIGLTSLLEHEADMTGERLGLFSYGSGCLAIFFGGILQPGYAQHLDKDRHRQMLDSRRELSMQEYEKLYSQRLPKDGSDLQFSPHTCGLFRLQGISAHKRLYSRSAALPSAAPAERARRAHAHAVC
ncbi:MAG: hydroxymethylglutaryl-CoA synthase [Kiritimatiellia bacterium]